MYGDEAQDGRQAPFFAQRANASRREDLLPIAIRLAMPIISITMLVGSGATSGRCCSGRR